MALLRDYNNYAPSPSLQKNHKDRKEYFQENDKKYWQWIEIETKQEEEQDNEKKFERKGCNTIWLGDLILVSCSWLSTETVSFLFFKIYVILYGLYIH